MGTDNDGAKSVNINTGSSDQQQQPLAELAEVAGDSVDAAFITISAAVHNVRGK